MSSHREVDKWFDRRRLTLDLAALSEEQRREGSIFLGGSAAEFVRPDDSFDYANVATVVFDWGDPMVEDVLAQMLEHNDNPDEQFLFPFSASTIIGSELWMLAVQDKRFLPALAYRSADDYFEIPFDKAAGTEALEKFKQLFPTRCQGIGQVGTRWFLFEGGIEL